MGLGFDIPSFLASLSELRMSKKDEIPSGDEQDDKKSVSSGEVLGKSKTFQRLMNDPVFTHPCCLKQTKQKRKVETINVISENSETANPFFGDHCRPRKRSKDCHYNAEIVVEIEDRDGNLVPIRGFLDTGTSSTIVLRQFVRKGRAKSYKGQRTTWSMPGGSFSTYRKAAIQTFNFQN